MQIIFKKIKNTKITHLSNLSTSVSNIIVLKENFKIIRSNFTDYKKVNRREIIGETGRRDSDFSHSISFSFGRVRTVNIALPRSRMKGLEFKISSHNFARSGSRAIRTVNRKKEKQKDKSSSRNPVEWGVLEG